MVESWGLSHGIESWESSHGSIESQVGPVMRIACHRWVQSSWWVQSRWVQSQEAGHEEHQEHRHCIVAMKIGSFHFANSGRTSWSRPFPWPVF
jgi:hypothetical protein